MKRIISGTLMAIMFVGFSANAGGMRLLERRQQALMTCINTLFAMDKSMDAAAKRLEEKNGPTRPIHEQCPEKHFFSEDHPELSEEQVEQILAQNYFNKKNCENQAMSTYIKDLLKEAGQTDLLKKEQACKGI